MRGDVHSGIPGVLCCSCWRVRLRYLPFRRAVARAFRHPRLHG